MSLRRAAASGVKWTVASAAVTMGVRLATLAVLARLLDRADFGLATMIVALVSILQAFGDFGLGNAIVKNTEPSAEQLSSVFWFAQLLGLVAFAAVILLEPAVVAFYREPRLDGLVFWLALRFLVAPVAIPFQGLLHRELRFRALFWIQSSAAIAGAALAIVGARAGWGVLALVAGDLASSVLLSALTLIVGWHRWHPRWRFRRADLRGYVGFGLNQVGDRAANLFATNIDYILVGRVLGSVALGVYSVAFEISTVPTRLNAVLTRVAFPIFARKRDDDAALARGYIEMGRLIALAQFPLLVGIAVLADLIVPVLLGVRWVDAVPLIRVLSIYGLVRLLGNPSGPLLLAKGRADVAFRLNLGFAVSNALAFYFVVPRGVLALSWTWVALAVVQFAIVSWALGRAAGIDAARYLAAMARPAASAVLAAAYLWAARVAVAAVTDAPAAQLLGAVVIGAALFIPTVWWIERRFIAELLTLLRNRPGGAGPSA